MAVNPTSKATVMGHGMARIIPHGAGTRNRGAVRALGADTGKLTSALVARTAAELSARIPAVPALVATAESNGLPGGRAEAALAAQSFYWFATRDAV